MASVIVEGTFMGASVKTSNYEGQEKSSLLIDVYQPFSESIDKMVQIKSDDLSLVNTINKDFVMGSEFKCKALVNAYKNKAYFKLVKIGD
jgi:hypothetical protein